MEKNSKYKRFASRSFWTIMLIHVVVFTSIGLFTAKGWRLLITFLIAFAITLVFGRLARICYTRIRERRKLNQNI